MNIFKSLTQVSILKFSGRIPFQIIKIAKTEKIEVTVNIAIGITENFNPHKFIIEAISTNVNETITPLPILDKDPMIRLAALPENVVVPIR